MSLSTRDAILGAALDLFTRDGVDATTTAAICRAAGVSNGSFFHAFPNKAALAAEIWIEALSSYHAAMLAVVAAAPPAAAGVRALVATHLDWVTGNRTAAHFLFEQARPDWTSRSTGRRAASNDDFLAGLDAWRQPLVRAGSLHDLPAEVFAATILGPAQIFCRAWLSGRFKQDPRDHLDALADCAVRALVV